MKEPSQNHDFVDELDSLALNEQDELWQLLEKAPAKEASQLFSRNVLREVRLQEQSQPSFWKSLFQPRFILPLSVAALLSLAALPMALAPKGQDGNTLADVSSESQTTLVSYLDEQLLLAAADEPSLFSDDEVIAMLY